MSKFVNFTMLEFTVAMELDHYEEHTTRIEKMFSEEVKKLHSKMQKDSSHMNGYDKAEYIENFKSDYEYECVIYKIPDIQRKSELISLYTILENNFVKICRMQEEKSDNPVKMDDFKITGYIDKAKTYLQKVVQIDFPSDSKVWEEIKFIQELRNKCVHSGATIPTGNGNLISYIRKLKYLELNNQDQLEIGEGYTKHCISIFRKFFLELFPKLKEKNTPLVKLVKS